MTEATKRVIAASFAFGLISLSFFAVGDEKITIMANKNRTVFADFLFRYITWLGSSYVYIVPAIYYWYKNKKYIILFFANFVLTALVVIFIKRMFPESERPKYALSKIYDLDLIPGFDYHRWQSFPSGHSSTIFSLILLFLLIEQKPRLAMPLLLLATLVGFSRIYLLQHFFVDVYFGMIIGFICTYIVYFLLINRLDVMDGKLKKLFSRSKK